MNRLTNWLGEWVETLRIAPPFSRRRRDLLDAIAQADRDMYNPDRDMYNPEAWVEVDRPGGAS